MNKLFISIIICLLFYLFIKEDGLLDYYKGYNQLIQLKANQLEINEELNQINNENYLLKNNDRYIEKIAREEYFYIYPNEIIISLY
tara:strand:+ start:12367 stop:12624 length:258 start_codon:yes stop_codon:yes gene_type:complete